LLPNQLSRANTEFQGRGRMRKGRGRFFFGTEFENPNTRLELALGGEILKKIYTQSV